MSKIFTPAAKRDLAELGFAIVDVNPDVETFSLVPSLGIPLENHQKTIVSSLCPAASGNSSSYTGIHGLGEFPFHTDCAHWPKPPRYLGLRAVQGDEQVKTKIISAGEALRPFCHNVLRRIILKPRRPFRGKQYLYRLLETGSLGENRIRWDENFLIPANEQAASEFENFRSTLSKLSYEEFSLIDSSQILIVDNWKALHARGSVKGSWSPRHIERFYLEKLH